MLYSTRSWFRDLICFSAFAVLLNALVDSGYGQPNTVIQVLPLIASAGPGTNAQFQVQVTNNGAAADTFLIFGATDITANAQLPAVFGQLATQPVIAPGQTFAGTLPIAVPAGTPPGSIPIVIVAISQNYSGQGPATISVAANGVMLGVTASSSHRHRTRRPYSLSWCRIPDRRKTLTLQPSPILMAVSKPIWYGTSTQQNPRFTLPGLATGQLSLNVSGTPPGSVTVTIVSLTDPTVTATATANICQNCAQAPIARAGAPQMVSVGSSATLDGSGSSDPNTPHYRSLITGYSGARPREVH